MANILSPARLRTGQQLCRCGHPRSEHLTYGRPAIPLHGPTTPAHDLDPEPLLCHCTWTACPCIRYTPLAT